MSERNRVTNAVFAQGDQDFVGTTIISASGVDPKDVYTILRIMDCVTQRKSDPAKPKSLNIYTVTGIPPKCCDGCALNAPEGFSCSRAPNFHDLPEADQGTAWIKYLEMCQEAQDGRLTDRDGNPIVPIGHWDGERFIVYPKRTSQ